MTLPRPLVTLRLLLVLALVALAAPLFVNPVANTAVAADTGSESSKTVEGDWHRWIPNAKWTDDPDGIYPPYWTGKYDENTKPSVTVDRTTNLGDEVVNVSWKNFTPTSNIPEYADPPDQGGKPTAVPFRTATEINTYYGVDILQCRGDAPTKNPLFVDDVNDASQFECYQLPTDAPQDGAPGVNNRIRTVTRNDGTGFAQFHVENLPTNNLLRCSPTQACSLVVVPIAGGRWDNQSELNSSNPQSTVDCNDHTLDFYNAKFNEFGPYFAEADGVLSPCAWSKRITVPLTFAPIPGTCPGGDGSFTAVGSPPLARGLNQLLSGWCRGARALNFDYNFSATEANARSQFLRNQSSGLTSAVDVALTSQPADSSLAGQRQFKYAPVANDAVAIPYAIDNMRTGRPITDLRLNARLVAKLLTQSYAPYLWNCPIQNPQSGGNAFYCAKDISDNPATIFDDPEFQRLNFRGDHPDRDSFVRPGGPSTPPGAGAQQEAGSFFPTVVGGESDSTYALTRWIASDPDANAFMRGKADPWKTRINPNYLVKGGLLYPTTQFEALDPGYSAPAKAYTGTGSDPRLKQGIQAAYNPVSSASLVAANLLRGRSTAYSRDGFCESKVAGGADCDSARESIQITFPRAAPANVGVRDLTGVTDNTDAATNGLPTAQLLTSKGTFVAPTRPAMASAAAGMRTAADGVTQYVDFARASKEAYPLLLPVYAMVPTCGLTTTKTNAIRDMLGRVASSQTYGDTPGTLVRGLLKLTSKQLADTRSAARLVSSKRCTPSASNNSPDSSNGGNKGNGDQSSSDGSGGNGGGSDSGNGFGSTGGGGAPASGGPAAPSPGATSAAPSNGSSSAPNDATNVGYRLNDDGGSLSLLPIVLLLGALLLIGGPVGWWAMATAPGRTARDRLRHLVVGAGGWRK